nr:hypothetical protein [Nostoc sp. ChiQUE02]
MQLNGGLSPQHYKNREINMIRLQKVYIFKKTEKPKLQAFVLYALSKNNSSAVTSTLQQTEGAAQW